MRNPYEMHILRKCQCGAVIAARWDYKQAQTQEGGWVPVLFCDLDTFLRWEWLALALVYA